jgi:hypothetical protein
MRCAAPALLLLLAACAPQMGREASVLLEATPEVPLEWRSVASAADADRIGALDQQWTLAWEEAKPRFATALAREGDLLRADAALERVMPPPGRYSCRVVRLGGAPASAFQPFNSQFCFIGVDEELTTFVKETGTQRPAGRLWPDGDRRLIFLGTDAGPGTAPASPYGDDPKRNLTGVMERVGPFRWRLVLMAATPGVRLDVIELVPHLD